MNSQRRGTEREGAGGVGFTEEADQGVVSAGAEQEFYPEFDDPSEGEIETVRNMGGPMGLTGYHQGDPASAWPPLSDAWKEVCRGASLSRVQALTENLLAGDSEDDIPMDRLATILGDTDRLRATQGLADPGGTGPQGLGDAYEGHEGHDGLTGSVSPSRSPSRYRGEPATPQNAQQNAQHNAVGGSNASARLQLPQFCPLTDLSLSFRQAARERKLSRLSNALSCLTEQKVKEIIYTVVNAGGAGGVRFAEWQRISAELTFYCPDLENFLSPESFALLPRPDASRESPESNLDAVPGTLVQASPVPTKADELILPVEAVQEYICMVLQGLEDYSSFSQFSGDFQPYMDREALETFLQSKVLSCKYYEGIPESFLPFFLCGISKAILYFLDPVHRSRVRIRDLVRSPYLRQLLSDPNGNLQPGLGELSGPLGKVFRTWFCWQTQENLFTAYKHVDEEGYGLLSMDNLRNLPGLGITEAFTKQLFLTVQTYDDHLDYRGYIDLLLAITFPANTACAGYLFPILDIRNHGQLSRSDILYYLREVLTVVHTVCAEGVELCIDDFVDEIYDFVKPADGETITLKDLRATRSAYILMEYLVDPNLLINKELDAQNGIVVAKAPAWEP